MDTRCPSCQNNLSYRLVLTSYATGKDGIRDVVSKCSACKTKLQWNEGVFDWKTFAAQFMFLPFILSLSLGAGLWLIIPLFILGVIPMLWVIKKERDDKTPFYEVFEE